MLQAIRESGAPCPAVFRSADDLLVMKAVPTDGTLRGPAWSSLADSLHLLHAAAAPEYG